MNIFAIVMISLLGLILVVLAFYLIIGALSYKVSMDAKSTVKKIAMANNASNRENLKIDFSWWDKQKSEELMMTNQEGLKLYSHLIENKSSDKLVIMVHGYGGCYKELNSQADLFLKKGYSVLAIECRAHDKSEGEMVGMGWLDRLDLKEWVEYMVAKNPNYKIVLFGQSMGASAVCMALGEKLPHNVICAISDCGFDNVYRQFYFVSSQHLKFITKPSMFIFNSYMKRVKKFNLKTADAVSQLKKSNLPVLFIHGTADKFVPVEMCYRLSEAVPEDRREVFIVEGAEHIESFAKDTTGYKRKVNNFLKKYGM